MRKKSVILVVLVAALSGCPPYPPYRPPPPGGLAGMGDVEPNDSPAQAQFVQQLSIGDSVSINGNTSFFDTQDWFEFDVAVSARLFLMLGFGTGDLDIEIYHQTGALAVFSSTDNPEIGDLFVPAGRVFIGVSTSFFSVTNYTLDVMAATP